MMIEMNDKLFIENAFVFPRFQMNRRSSTCPIAEFNVYFESCLQLLTLLFFNRAIYRGFWCSKILIAISESKAVKIYCSAFENVKDYNFGIKREKFDGQKCYSLAVDRFFETEYGIHIPVFMHFNIGKMTGQLKRNAMEH